MASPVSRDLSAERVVDFRHERAKRAGAAARDRVIADMQASQIEKARAIQKAAGDYIAALEAGWSYCGTIGVAREADIVLAVDGMAGSDAISEWAELCGVEL